MAGDLHRATCKECYDLLFDFLEGELPPERQAALDAHFQKCPPCRQFLTSYRATPNICREALEDAVPDEVASALHAFLRSKLGGG